MSDNVLRLSATGDSFIVRPCKQIKHPSFQSMIELIRSNEFNFTNLEVLLNNFEGYPSAESGGTWASTDPDIINDLTYMGFNGFSVANNHALDWGQTGLLKTVEVLNQSGVLHAGAGQHLGDARTPRYIDVPSGRIALIAMTTTFPSGANAGRQSSHVQGRPGINPLRVKHKVVVTSQEFDWLTGLSERLELSSYHKLLQHLGFESSSPHSLQIQNTTFERGETSHVKMEIHHEDKDDNLKAICDARRQADWVVVSIHSHEQVGSRREFVTEYFELFARQCIDYGADIVIGHGPHVLRGIEVYKNKPILYSLGNFFFENELVLFQPSDAYEMRDLPISATVPDLMDLRNTGGKGFPSDPWYWESVVVQCRLSVRGVLDIRLYPVELGFGRDRTGRGRPMLAPRGQGEQIITRVQELSQKYGTSIRWKDGFGEISLV